MKNSKSSKSSDFHSWMNSRVSSICNEPVYNPETGHYVKVIDCPAAVLLQHQKPLIERNKKGEKSSRSISFTAEDQARANKSDPFMKDRVASHLKSGISSIQDYHVEFIKKRIPFINVFNKEDYRIEEVPIKMTLP